jgi:peptidoglycan hydrolase-like protein with peptidoglycan-binding domain
MAARTPNSSSSFTSSLRGARGGISESRPRIRDWEGHFRAASKRGMTASFGQSTNPSVSDVQNALNTAGANPPLTVDGIAGPATTSAIQAFQSANGLSVDGVAGPQTLSALGFPGATAVSGGASAGASGGSSGIRTLKKIPMAPIPGIRQAVLDHFTDFTQQFEGNTPYMYTDIKGLVTTGNGNLIDDGTSNPAQGLGWVNSDGSLTSAADIDAAWHTVKNAWPGVQSTACASLTTIRLPPKAIANLVSGKVGQNHTILQTKFPGYTQWPADAQLALHSMAWAMGPAFNFPAFASAVNQQTPDFVTAATQSHMDDSANPGLVPRNAANAQLFQNAAAVMAKNGNFDSLYWPGSFVAAAIDFMIVLAAGVAAVFGASWGYKVLRKKKTPIPELNIGPPPPPVTEAA